MQKHSTRFELLNNSYREFGKAIYHFHLADKRAEVIKLLKKVHFILSNDPHYKI